jgi:outer membrane murein-binding lipoprotein Lpp
MDEQMATQLILFSAVVVTVVFSSGAVWLAINFARTSTESVKAAAEAARSIAASVDKIEAMVNAQRSADGEKQGASPGR